MVISLQTTLKIKQNYSVFIKFEIINKTFYEKTFTLLLLAFPIIAFSQTKFIFGLEGGANLSSIRAKQDLFLDQSSKIGILTGITTQYSFNKRVFFKSGLYYENKGSKGVAIRSTDSNGATIAEAKGTNNFHYVHIPFLVKTTFGSKAKFFANAGPNIGFLINQTNSVQQSKDFNGFKESFTEMYKRIEFGVSGGLGFSTQLNEKLGFSAEIRDNLGLTNVNKAINFPEKTNSINLLFGISRTF